ncbi:hypothetical protein NEH60_19765, partial [Xanthomonas hortorum pv. pelargonii]|nr:hypothetical protein [Xanthomonas hortorum pv. pelargonii]
CLAAARDACGSQDMTLQVLASHKLATISGHPCSTGLRQRWTQHSSTAVAAEDDVAALAFLADLVSRQHPDHDTEQWPV